MFNLHLVELASKIKFILHPLEVPFCGLICKRTAEETLYLC